jgi:biotin-(acetyl-CoA carboxylase) ligase
VTILADSPECLVELGFQHHGAPLGPEAVPAWLLPMLPHQGVPRVVAASPDQSQAHQASEPFWDHLVAISRAPASQYDQLRQLPAQLSRQCGNVACLALVGQEFHGQRGRPWQTLPGNFHWSGRVVLDLPAATCGRALVALPALAVLDVLDPLARAQDSLGIKWVNDILWGERKIAGVLTAVRSLGEKLESVVFGVGINLAATPSMEASSLAPWATSLAEQLPAAIPLLGAMFLDFNAAVAARVGQLRREGPEALVAVYRQRSLVLGREVAIWAEDTVVPGPLEKPLRQGRVAEILPDLSLLLEGQAEPVHSGRVVLTGNQS